MHPLSRRTYLDGVRAAAPIGVAAFAFGLSFGVLARSADMGRVAPVVMSVTTFAGSAQFAVASILGAGGGLVTAIGAFAGDLVADPESLGLDAAFPALFLTLLWPQVRERSRLLAALGGAAIALALMPFTGPGVPIVAASLACLIGARRSV